MTPQNTRLGERSGLREGHRVRPQIMKYGTQGTSYLMTEVGWSTRYLKQNFSSFFLVNQTNLQQYESSVLIHTTQ